MSGDHKFKTVVLHGLTSLFHALVAEACAQEGTPKDSHPIYNQIISRLIPVLRRFRPLPLIKVITGNTHIWEAENPSKNRWERKTRKFAEPDFSPRMLQALGAMLDIVVYCHPNGRPRWA